ncbi:hypothetical protein P2318_33170 [Myxococcaceae bacterium GXIMD 01537]
MFRIAAAAAVVVALTGCSGMSRSQVGDRDGNANVTGIVALPSSGLQKGEDPCAGVQVQVAHAGTSNAVGNVSVKQSRGRCMYVASNVPSNKDLQVTVTPGTAWKCENGAAPAFSPASVAVKVPDYATATRDFTVGCAEAATQSTATP